MYRLFLKIFFWYWLTAWGMIAIVLLGSRLTGMRQVSRSKHVCDGCAYPGGGGR